METVKKVYDFLEDAKTFYLATMEGDQPRVRPYGAILFFEGKIYIMAFGKTNATRQIAANNKAGDVTKALGADRKDVDKAFAELKKEGAIVSPVRCKWAPAN